MNRTTVMALCIALVAAACSGGTSSRTPPRSTVPASGSVAGGRIAFASERDGNAEIYVVNADGAGLRRLTNDPAEDDGPAWSPGGTMIAFVSTRDGNEEIYVMNADGTGVRRVTEDPSEDLEPSRSPSGEAS